MLINFLYIFLNLLYFLFFPFRSFLKKKLFPIEHLTTIVCIFYIYKLFPRW